MRLTALIALVPLSAVLSAQGSYVSPTHFGSAEGPNNRFAPFALENRYLMIHDDMMGSIRILRGITLRREGTFTANYQGFTVTMDAWCSTALTTSQTPDAVIDNNHGPDKMQVVINRTFNMPAAPLASVPGRFLYDIPFTDSAFVHAGTGPLCWEIKILGNTIPAFGTPALDAVNAAQIDPPLAVASFGTGCLVSGGTRNMTAAGSSQMIWGNGTGNLIVNGTSGPLNGVVLFFLGLSDTSFSGVPLPISVPGSSGGPSGECRVYTDILFGLASPTDGNGASSTSVPVPATADLHGLRTFSQLWALDAAANATGVVTSNAINHNWVAPFFAVSVGNVFQNRSTTTPVATPGQGLVVRFNL